MTGAIRQILLLVGVGWFPPNFMGLAVGLFELKEYGMSEERSTERILTRNSIKKFILRVDFMQNTDFEIREIAEAMAIHFDRIEKKQISKFHIHFTESDSELSKQDTFDFVLISEANSVSMTFSEIQKAIWLESSQYRSKETYSDILSKTISEISKINAEMEARRIGLRYVNEFKCEKSRNIGRIFGKRLSLALKHMSSSEAQSRVIGVEEYNNDGYKLRLQYGIPNKFYPAVITLYDLMLDIDSYFGSSCRLEDWETIIADLNHAAYERFVSEINPKYLEELK